MFTMLIEEFKKFTQESKVTIFGIVITFLMSSYALFLQYKEEIELSVIANFYSTTTLGENIEHRLTFINSGNTPLSVERVFASIKTPQGKTVNSEVDIIEPFVIPKKDMLVVNLNHILIGKGIKGLHKTAVTFSVIDSNGKIYKNNFELGQLAIGNSIKNGQFQYRPTQKLNLLTGEQTTIKM
ncbi:hypothetical protein [Pseudoalteromonas sp. OF7H-1]|uniref:hypothetical protein n=1 Tax=Pseudoalteromonas sp. OF7H-1 TaxID=2917755 RepID=UPI001EF44A26|nr:hypothetical protein [Pseudoalteromonas sp. OF7H-1]MCG7540586.1 hypothetical protein [Pseudoalteromonas sp. OF7H-1]